ncbi:Protein ACTIVITY OF BC1 COMPLEX KINASE 3, partial [Durusdinium trenchii]
PIVPQIRDYFEPRMSNSAAAAGGTRWSTGRWKSDSPEAVSFKTIIDGLEEVIFKNYPFSVPAFYALVVRCWVEVGPGTEHLA